MRKAVSRRCIELRLHEDASRPVAGGSRDSRDGLGFAILQPRFHKPQTLGADFPYDEPDTYEDLGEPDEETERAVRSKSTNFKPSDSIPQKSVRPFYFAEGKHFLADCFWGINKILVEIAAFGDSMSSVPQQARGRGSSTGGGSFPYPGGGGSNYKRTGTKRGWSQAPPLSIVAAEDLYEDEDPDAEIYSLSDLAKKEEESAAFAK